VTYYETKVVDYQGRQIDAYVDDASTASEALALAQRAFREDHPDKDPNQHQFEARLRAEGALVPGYGR